MAQYSTTPSFHHSNVFFVQPADEVFPAAHGKALVGIVNLQLFGAEISRLAMQQREMIPFTEHGETGGPFDYLLDAFTDDGVAVGAHQNHRAVAQGGGESFSPPHRGPEDHA